MCFSDLPVYDFIYHLALLAAGLLKVDAGRFDAAMAQKIGQQGDVVVLFKEVLGEKKEAEIHAKAAENSVKKDPPPPGFVMVGGKGNQLCKDEFSGHYFWSNSEQIWKVMNEITHQCGYNEFTYLYNYYYEAGVYDAIECKYVNELGWPQNTKLEPEFSCALGSGEYENIPVLVVGFNKRPDHPKNAWDEYM